MAAQIISFDQALNQAQAAPPAYAPPPPPAAPDPATAAASAAATSGAPVQGPPMPAAVSIGGQNMPAFALNMQPPAAPSDPTRSGLYNLLSSGGAPLGDAGTAQRMAHANALDTLSYTPGVMDHAYNFIAGNAAGAAKLNEQAENAKTFNDPNIMAYLKANPDAAIAAAKNPSAAATSLKSALDAAMANAKMMHTYTKDDGTTFAKTMTQDQADHVAAQAHITGEDPAAVHAVAHHRDFTDQEFEDATKNLSWGTMMKLVGMQHYLSPEQQLMPAYLNQLSATEQKAKADYDAAVNGGMPKAQQDKLAANLKTASEAKNGLIKTLLEKQQAIYPSSVTGAN